MVSYMWWYDSLMVDGLLERKKYLHSIHAEIDLYHTHRHRMKMTSGTMAFSRMGISVNELYKKGFDEYVSSIILSWKIL